MVLENIGAQTTFILNLFFYIAIIVILGGIGFFIFYIGKFKHVVRINTGNIVTLDRARKVKRENGDDVWTLLKKRETMPIPPDNVLKVTARGRKFVDTYRTESGEYIFFENEIQELNGKFKATFKPLTANQKMFYTNELKRAYNRKKADWKQNLPVIASIGTMAIVVIMLMVMWGSIAEPVLNMGDKVAKNNEVQRQITEKQVELVSRVSDLLQERQTIGAENKPGGKDK